MLDLPEKFQQEIKKKGFMVYEYISFWELMQTVKRDYLSVLSKINIPFAIASVVVAYIAFEGGDFSLLLYFFLIAYAVIFLFLFLKLIQKTKYYFHINTVIFSQKGIILGEDIVIHDQEEKKILLEKYEDAFDEYLAQPSRLREIIKNKEQVLLQSTKNIFSKGSKLSDSISSNRNNMQIQVFLFAALGLYSASLFIFYFLGVFVGYFIFGIYAVIIKFFLYFSTSVELKIKYLVEDLEEKILRLIRIESVLEKKIQNFSEGEISDIAPFIGQKFSSFYTTIASILNKQKRLEKIIVSSAYSDFLDFNIFSAYLQSRYNTPVRSMIGLLLQHKQSIIIQKDAISAEKTTEEFSAHLSKKLLRLGQMEKDISNNIITLENMQIVK